MIRRMALATTVVLGIVVLGIVVLAAVEVAPIDAAPAQPTRLPSPSAVVALAAPHSAAVSWRPPTNTAGVKAYVVQAVDAGSRVVKVGLAARGSRSLTIGDLTPGSTLRFRVAAWYGWSRWLVVRRFSPLSAPITIPLDPCSGSVSASVTGAIAAPAEVQRSVDATIESTLAATCSGDWTYSWSYRRGNGPTTPVPSGWTGATTATLTIPKWTLDKYAVTGEDYTFTVTATPPAGTTAAPTTSDVSLRVISTTPVAGFLPYSGELPAGNVYFLANVGSLTIDPDYPVGDEHLTYQWAAIDLNVVEDSPAVVGGSATSPEVVFQFTALRSYEITLMVCRSDDGTANCARLRLTTSIADQGA